jgi:ribosomal silencing factor RsfS
MNAELKRREHIVILDVTECLMAEEVIFCHNTSTAHRKNNDNKRERKKMSGEGEKKINREQDA